MMYLAIGSGILLSSADIMSNNTVAIAEPFVWAVAGRAFVWNISQSFWRFAHFASANLPILCQQVVVLMSGNWTIGIEVIHLAGCSRSNVENLSALIDWLFEASPTKTVWDICRLNTIHRYVLVPYVPWWHARYSAQIISVIDLTRCCCYPRHVNHESVLQVSTLIAITTVAQPNQTLFRNNTIDYRWNHLIYIYIYTAQFSTRFRQNQLLSGRFCIIQDGTHNFNPIDFNQCASQAMLCGPLEEGTSS